MTISNLALLGLLTIATMVFTILVLVGYIKII